MIGKEELVSKGISVQTMRQDALWRLNNGGMG